VLRKRLSPFVVLCQDMVSTPRSHLDSDFIQRYRDDKPYSIINFWKLCFQIRKGGVRNPVRNVLVGCWSSRYNPELYLKGQHRF
jgi:hypothetical protein